MEQRTPYGWHPLLRLGGHLLDGADKFIEVGDRRIDVRGNANTTDVFPNDADGVDFAAIKECRGDLCGCHAVNADPADGARVIQIKRSVQPNFCLLYTSPSPRDGLLSRMPSSA